MSGTRFTGSVAFDLFVGLAIIGLVGVVLFVAAFVDFSWWDFG